MPRIIRKKGERVYVSRNEKKKTIDVRRGY